MRLKVELFSPEEIESVRATIVSRTRLDVVSLAPNPDPGHATPTFVAKLRNGSSVFVKLADPELLRRTRGVHALCADFEFVPRVLDDGEFLWNEYGVMCTEFRPGSALRFKELNERQFRALVEAYLAYSRRLQSLRSPELPVSYLFRQHYRYRAFSDCAAKSWLRRILLRDLVAAYNRCFVDGQGLDRVVHGDFHDGNFGFDGDRLVAAYDLVDVGRGLPVFELGKLLFPRIRTCRDGDPLLEYIGETMKAAGWSRDEWIAGEAFSGMCWANKVLEDQGDSLSTVLYIWRRRRRDVSRFRTRLERLLKPRPR